MREQITRRRSLKTAALIGAAATAGCLGDDDDDEPPNTESGETPGENADNGTSGNRNSGSPEDTNNNDNGITFSHPDSVQIDEAFSMVIENVSTELVTVEVALRDFQDVRWSSSATYELSGDTLSLDSADPNDAEFESGTMTLIQYASSDTVRSYAPNWFEGDEVSVTLSSEGETLGSTTINRTFGDITTIETNSDEFVGDIIEPVGDDSVPGIIVLHGSGGQPLRGLAQVLAANGFAALPLQYFDPEGQQDLLPQRLTEVPLEYVEAAANRLLDHNRVLGSRVGAWGVSRGGELALLSGSQFESIGAVVSINGSGYIWPGTGPESTSAWSYNGEPLNFLPLTDHENWTMEPPQEHEPAASASVEAASDAELADATIPAEEINGPVTLVSGGDDRLWNSQELHTVVTDRLDNHDQDYTHLVYEEAGHSIRYPYLPATNRDEDNQFIYGGTVAGYAEAENDYWQEALNTFETLHNNDRYKREDWRSVTP